MSRMSLQSCTKEKFKWLEIFCFVNIFHPKALFDTMQMIYWGYYVNQAYLTQKSIIRDELLIYLRRLFGTGNSLSWSGSSFLFGLPVFSLVKILNLSDLVNAWLPLVEKFSLTKSVSLDVHSDKISFSRPPVFKNGEQTEPLSGPLPHLQGYHVCLSPPRSVL